ncbi:MAG TPA: Uma2 family endonuclease [Ktedonobacterales bacterium]|nr:Uma2 family endonuclease [Ktedonobacterales bacterium]
MQPATKRLTYKEFLDRLDEDTLAEWVDGAMLMTSPASLRHQQITDFLTEMLGTYTRLHGLGRVVSAPFQMKIGQSGREPDVLFVNTAHLDRFRETYLDGPADLVVEVISLESAGRDRGDKFYEYEAAGISEYWLIDPRTERAEFYQLNAQGMYQLVAPDATGVYRSSAVQGFWLYEAWLWQEPAPDIEDAMLEVAGDTYARQMIERLRRRGFLPAEDSDGA